MNQFIIPKSNLKASARSALCVLASYFFMFRLVDFKQFDRMRKHSMSSSGTPQAPSATLSRL